MTNQKLSYREMVTSLIKPLIKKPYSADMVIDQIMSIVEDAYNEGVKDGKKVRRVSCDCEEELCNLDHKKE